MGEVWTLWVLLVQSVELPVSQIPTPSSFIILYADDILLIAPSVTELQSLFYACEKELKWLDMKINVKKSCCIRIGQIYDIKCANITDSHGFSLPWVKEIRYLHHLRSSVQMIFDSGQTILLSVIWRHFWKKNWRLASEEVILELVGSKCLPVLLYGLECYQLIKSELSSLDFVITRVLMTLFKSANVRLINDGL